jgi:hypothetical protein
MWYIRGEGCLGLPLLLGNLFATFSGLPRGPDGIGSWIKRICGKRMRNVMCSIRGWMAGLLYDISARYRVGGLGQRLGGGV